MHNDSMELAVDWLSKPEGGGAYSKLMMTEEKAEVRVEADELGIEGVALGVASGFVTDAQLTASSSFDPELVAATATSETTPVATPVASTTTEAAETTATSPVAAALAATTSTETTAAEGMAATGEEVSNALAAALAALTPTPPPPPPSDASASAYTADKLNPSGLHCASRARLHGQGGGGAWRPASDDNQQ
jgi:hypothetical protein